jgi:hypothetical protein
MVSAESQSIMDDAFNAIGGDLNKAWSGKMHQRMPDAFMMARVKLIRLHYDGMNDVERARAERTLKQIGG